MAALAKLSDLEDADEPELDSDDEMRDVEFQVESKHFFGDN